MCWVYINFFFIKMSFTKRVFYIFGNLKIFFQNKSTQRYAIFVLSFFLTLGVFLNSYTVMSGEEGYDTIGMYEEVDELSSVSTGVEGKHSHKSQGFGLVDFLGSSLDIIYPQGNKNYGAIVANPNLSPATKLGLIGYVDMPISAMLYNPPYIDIPEHLAQEWVPNYVPKAGIYADSGYQQLQSSGIVELWSVARNVAYMFFVIVFIIGGFMIMFRHKIGGQMMVTVYNTLPGIIVGLVLVTFSFAIVGLMIDIGAVLINVLKGYLDTSYDVDPTNPFGVADVYSHVAVFQIVLGLLQALEGWLLEVATWLMSRIIGGIARFVLYVIVLYISIKIFFTLIKAYIGILFNTITGPIILAIATVPGKKGIMKDWFFRIAKNVLVFVIVFFLLHIPLYFFEQGTMLHIFGGDLSGSTTQSIVDGYVMAGVTLYVLFLAPGVPKMLDEYFPQSGGKGAQAMGEVGREQASKIPLVGGFFKK